jgi:hypothetical protein
MDLVHKMMKNQKWGVRGTSRGRGMGWAIQRVGKNIVGYQIVGDGDGSKGIAIKWTKKRKWG